MTYSYVDDLYNLEVARNTTEPPSLLSKSPFRITSNNLEI